MFTLLLGGALLGGAAYAAWQLLQQMLRNAPGDQPGDGAGREDPTRGRERSRPDGPDALIEEIVRRTTFATKRMVVGHTVVGTESRVSLTPADDLIVRPMLGMGELPRTLLKTQALDDDLYYAQAASNQLPVIEHRERIDLTEPQYGPSRNVLLVLPDVSGSTNGARSQWISKLCQKLARKCASEKAECVMIPFNLHPQPAHSARTPEECERLAREIPNILMPGGDTDIDAALEEGMNILEKEKFGEAKILLVTDGTVAINERATSERLKSLGVTLHTVCIGEDHSQLRSVSQRYDFLGMQARDE